MDCHPSLNWSNELETRNPRRNGTSGCDSDATGEIDGDSPASPVRMAEREAAEGGDRADHQCRNEGAADACCHIVTTSEDEKEIRVKVGLDGAVMILSADDADLVDRPWHRVRGYALGREKGKTKSAHRTILERKLGRKLVKGEVCDHINGNPLDNRRVNLRLTDALGNAQNRTRPVRGKRHTPYRGVSYSVMSRAWVASATYRGTTHPCGLHETAESAAEAARLKRIELGFLGEDPNGPPITNDIRLHKPKPRRDRPNQIRSKRAPRATLHWNWSGYPLEAPLGLDEGGIIYMPDLWADDWDDARRDRVFAVMALADHNAYWIETKWPDRAAAYIRDAQPRVRNECQNIACSPAVQNNEQAKRAALRSRASMLDGQWWPPRRVHIANQYDIKHGKNWRVDDPNAFAVAGEWLDAQWDREAA